MKGGKTLSFFQTNVDKNPKIDLQTADRTELAAFLFERGIEYRAGDLTTDLRSLAISVENGTYAKAGATPIQKGGDVDLTGIWAKLTELDGSIAQLSEENAALRTDIINLTSALAGKADATPPIES